MIGSPHFFTFDKLKNILSFLKGMLPELYYCEEIIVQLRTGINMLNKKLNIVNMTILFIYSLFAVG